MGKGGGGSSGGGGGTGAVDYPDYMEVFHSNMLGGSDPAGTLTVSHHYLTEAIDVAMHANPYTGVSAYNPDTPVASMQTAIADVVTLVTMAGVTSFSTFLSAIHAAIDSTVIASSVASYSSVLQDELDTVAIPKFEAGMRDINAVMSSAFVIGRAILQDSKSKQVAKYTADLETHKISSVFDIAMKILDERRLLAHLRVEAYRMQVAAKKEEADENMRIDVAESKWEFDVWQLSGNILASIGGARGNPSTAQENAPSAIGGAMSGAAAGALIGSQIAPGIGTAIGAAAGGIAGIFGSMG
jgi:hypothetical protein